MDKKAAVEAFEKTHIIMHKLAGKMNSEYDLKYSDQILKALMWFEKNGKKRLKDIAAQTGISASSLCILFNEMEKENLILREIDKNDRRNRYYFLSETGERAANEAIEQFKKNMLKIFEPLSEDEMECITKSFDVINQILEKYIKSDNEKI